ncbi:SWIM zinc finger family protein [Cyanobium sp. FGCU-6]|nr:SWIM zinc finger family protein [Cyanobium sp. FGCU6]
MAGGAWKALEQAMAARLGWTAQLLNGEVPRDLEEPFDAVGVPLFPRRWADLQVRCGCPDDAVPCKHFAAVLYKFAQRLDEDPWLLLAWNAATASSCWPTCAAMPPNRPTPRACPPGGPWACGPAGAAGDGRRGTGAAAGGVVPAAAGGGGAG